MEKVLYPVPETTRPGEYVDVPPNEPPPAIDITKLTNEDIEKALPTPAGFKLLVTIPRVEEKLNGMFIKAEETKHHEQMTTVVALVVDVGPEAYLDKTRFPSGPWCKKGDYVLIGPYRGQRFTVYGQEFRIINDDCVEGVVPDPRGYRRI